MKICIISSFAPSLVNFRLPLIMELKNRGYEIHVIAPFKEEHCQYAEILTQREITVHSLALDRALISPVSDIKYLFSLVKIFAEQQFSTTIFYTKKPIIYGNLAALFQRVPNRISIITGLGYGFSQSTLTFSIRAIRVCFLYSLSLSHKLIFMNKEDQDEINTGLKKRFPLKRQIVINGSGVDLAHFSFHPLPKTEINFLFIGRLIKSKGITEFYHAAKQIKADCPEATFTIVGDVEKNADSISDELVERLKSSRDVCFVGPVSDVRPYLKACHIFVLPSYREGLPRSVLEALAMGRAVITTNAPGCKETVIENENGLLVPVADERSLIKAMRYLLSNTNLIPKFGYHSRKLAEMKFSDEAIAHEIANFI